MNKLFHIGRYFGRFIGRYRVIYQPIFQISVNFCCKRYRERFSHIVSATRKKEISADTRPTRPIFKTGTEIILYKTYLASCIIFWSKSVKQKLKKLKQEKKLLVGTQMHTSH